MLGPHVGEDDLDGVTEDDRVGDLHHRGLHVQREQDARVLRVGDLFGEERPECADAHDRRVDDLTGQDRNIRLQHRDRSVGVDVFDPDGPGGLDRDGLLVRREVTPVHRGDVGLGVGGPFAHGMRVLLRVLLHRLRCPAVRVALAQYRVDGRAEGDAVLRSDVLVLIGLRIVGEIGEVVALRLQFADGFLQLRNRRRDVRQLDDVRSRRESDLAEFGERIGHPLFRRQTFGELRQDATGERDVPGVDVDAGCTGECGHDRQERVGRQCRRLVGDGVDDRRFGHVSARFVSGIRRARRHRSLVLYLSTTRETVTPTTGPAGSLSIRSGSGSLRTQRVPSSTMDFAWTPDQIELRAQARKGRERSGRTLRTTQRLVDQRVLEGLRSRTRRARAGSACVGRRSSAAAGDRRSTG